MIALYIDHEQLEIILHNTQPIHVSYRILVRRGVTIFIFGICARRFFLFKKTLRYLISQPDTQKNLR